MYVFTYECLNVSMRVSELASKSMWIMYIIYEFLCMRVCMRDALYTGGHAVLKIIIQQMMSWL